MGFGFRIFAVGNDGAVRRIPLARYEALLRRAPKGAFPEYAGKRVRAAIVTVEIADRRPVDLQRVEYAVWYFDKHGQLDKLHEEKLRRTAVQLLAVGAGLSKDHFEKHRTRFGRAQTEHEDRWQPSPELQAYLRALALGHG